MTRYDWQLSGTSHSMNYVPKGATVMAVGERPVICRCEGCEKWIYEEEQYVVTADDVYLHRKCAMEEAT